MKAIRFMAVGVLLALAACSKPAPTEKAAETPAVPAKPPIVTVNGKPISEQLYEEYAKALARRPLSELTPEDREQIKENLVRVELIAQEAEKSGLTNDPEVTTRLAARQARGASAGGRAEVHEGAHRRPTRRCAPSSRRRSPPRR